MRSVRSRIAVSEAVSHVAKFCLPGLLIQLQDLSVLLPKHSGLRRSFGRGTFQPGGGPAIHTSVAGLRPEFVFQNWKKIEQRKKVKLKSQKLALVRLINKIMYTLISNFQHLGHLKNT